MTDANLRANGFPITFARHMAELQAIERYGQQHVDDLLDRAAVHFTGDLKPLPEPTEAELDAMVDEEMGMTRDELIADARRAVLTPYCSSLSGARRSTKRDAVEAAFEHAMLYWATVTPYPHGDQVLKDRQQQVLTERMYDHVSRKMRASWTWMLLWLVVRPAVRAMVVALVAWLLTRETEA